MWAGLSLGPDRHTTSHTYNIAEHVYKKPHTLYTQPIENFQKSRTGCEKILSFLDRTKPHQARYGATLITLHICHPSRVCKAVDELSRNLNIVSYFSIKPSKPNMVQTCQCHQCQIYDRCSKVFFFLQSWIFANSASVCLWGENVNTPTVCRCFLALINPKKDSQIEDGRSDQHRVFFILEIIASSPTFIERNESANDEGKP